MLLRRLLLTLPISVSCVGQLVRDNASLLAEAPWALGACVGLLAGVCPLVRRNVAFVAEAPENQRLSINADGSRSINRGLAWVFRHYRLAGLTGLVSAL